MTNEKPKPLLDLPESILRLFPKVDNLAFPKRDIWEPSAIRPAHSPAPEAQ